MGEKERQSNTIDTYDQILERLQRIWNRHNYNNREAKSTQRDCVWIRNKLLKIQAKTGERR